MTYPKDLRSQRKLIHKCLKIRQVGGKLKVISRIVRLSTIATAGPIRRVVKPACKPGSVQGNLPLGSHSSRPQVTRRLKRPTREQRELRCRSPIWSCSGWGLACRPCCQDRGGLLPATPARAGSRATLRLHAPFHPCQRGVGTHFGGLLSVPLRRRPRDRGRDSTAVPFLPTKLDRSFHAEVQINGLSVALRRPAVSRHPALWSPDFPLHSTKAMQRLPGQLHRYILS